MTSSTAPCGQPCRSSVGGPCGGASAAASLVAPGTPTSAPVGAAGAASSARSVGCSLGGGCWRRSTASSWRSTRISISLASTDRKQSRISSADEGSRRGRIAVLRRAVPTGHGHDRLLAPDGPPTGCWRPAAVIESELIGGSAARGGGSELDAVGPLQLLDPVVLDGDAVALGQLVVLLGAGATLVRQDRPQPLEVGFQPGRRQHLDHPRRGAARVP